MSLCASLRAIEPDARKSRLDPADFAAFLEMSAYRRDNLLYNTIYKRRAAQVMPDQSPIA